MNEHVAEVKDDPPPGGCTFGPLGPNACLCHPLADGAINGSQLALVRSSRDHKVVGKRRKLVDVQHDRVASGCVADDVGQEEGTIPPLRRTQVGRGGLRIFSLSRHGQLADEDLLVSLAGIEPATLGL